MAARGSPTKIFRKIAYPTIDPARPELSAKGKTIVITGGGTCIGQETAKSFAKAGAARIAILGRREKPLVDTKALIEAEFSGTKVFALPADITKQNEIDAAFAKVGGKVDVMVSNAATSGKIAFVEEMTADEYLEGIDFNLRGNFNVTKAFLKYKSDNAAVIDVNSCITHVNAGPFLSYSVAKTAVARFYNHLGFAHPELFIASIQPGAIDTEMSRNAGYKPKSDTETWVWKGDADAIALLNERDQVSLPGRFIVWLTSPEGRFLNGKYLWANWDVDELLTRQEEIEGSSLFNIGMVGWPFV